MTNSSIFSRNEVERAIGVMEELATSSAQFWADALMSTSFMYKGTNHYLTSNFYKGDHWVDSPWKVTEKITDNQIELF